MAVYATRRAALSGMIAARRAEWEQRFDDSRLYGKRISFDWWDESPRKYMGYSVSGPIEVL